MARNVPVPLQQYRGTTAQTDAYTGPVGEITVDTTKKTVVVHDGVTAGGYPLAKESTTITASNGVEISAGGTLGQNTTVSGVSASTSAPGVVQLNNAVDSTSQTQAATPKAVSDAISTMRNYVDSAFTRNVGTIYVDANNGVDSNDGLTSATAVKTINHALDLAGFYNNVNRQDAVIINVSSGTYAESVVVARNVLFVLEGDVTIQGSMTVVNCAYGYIGGNFVLTITGALAVSSNSRLFVGTNSLVLLNTVTTSVCSSLIVNSSISITVSNATIPMFVDGNSYFAHMPNTTKAFDIVSNNASTVVLVNAGGSFYTNSNSRLHITANNTRAACQVSFCGHAIFDGTVLVDGTTSLRGVVSTNNSAIQFNNDLTISLPCVNESMFVVVSSRIGLYGVTMVHGGTTVSTSIPCTVGVSSALELGGQSTFISNNNTPVLLVNSGSSLVATNRDRTIRLSLVSNANSSEALSATDASSASFAHNSTTLSISGNYAACTIRSMGNSFVDVQPSVNVENNATGVRFIAHRGGQINVSGSGLYRLPGSVDGIIDANSFGFYA